MICFIAMIVFGLLGIFSATHRKLAWEAFDCVFRKTTFRKCRTNLDDRLKSRIVGRLMSKNPAIARAVFRNFELLSFIFTILLVASLAYSAYGGYNYVRYGNCNGPSEQFCIFDTLVGDKNPFGHTTPSCSVSGAVASSEHELEVPDISLEPFIGSYDSKVTVVEFGCYTCPYTRDAQPAVDEMLKEYGDNVRFVFLHFPIESHNNSKESAIAAECAREQAKFWEYHELLFSDKAFENFDREDLVSYAQELSLDTDKFSSCLSSNETLAYVEDDISKGIESGVYGTPTFFINDESLVGPQSLRTFKKMINKELDR